MKCAIKRLFLFVFIFFSSIMCINAKSLPKLYFEGDITQMLNKSDIRNISVRYESDSVNFYAYAKLKLQGTSSMAYTKKNYNITLYEDAEYLSKFKIDFGWGNHSKYCLKANWIDKTHSRNIVTANIAAKVQKKYGLFEDTPNYGLIDGYPIEIYINDQFLGLYTLNIPKDDWLFNMDEDNPNNIVTFGRQKSNSVYFDEEATLYNGWEIEVGKENEETLEKLNRVIRFVMNSTDKEFKENIGDYFNLDSLLNYYVICEYADLFDNISKNLMLVTYDGKIWYTCLYDLDTSWGTEWTGLTLRNYVERTDLNKSKLFLRLEENFGNEIADRYFELRKDILNEETVLEEFNSFVNSIPEESFKLEQTKWTNIPGYGINQIEEFLNERTPLLDKYFESFYDNDAETKSFNSIKKYILFFLILIVIVFIIFSIKKIIIK